MHKAILVSLVSGCLFCAMTTRSAELPRISKSGDSGQLMVDGKPYLILGGELGNSSAGTAAQADSILPRLASMHVNTVLMPVAWEQIEPTEGSFDFSILDHWIDVARQQHLHLVILWFGSWSQGIRSRATRSSFPKQEWKAPPTTRCMLTGPPGPSGSVPSASTACTRR